MPMFEYRCESCGSGFEMLVRSGDTVSCPSCGDTKVQKQFSAFAVKSNASGLNYRAGQAAGACGSCGDPRGPGACALQPD